MNNSNDRLSTWFTSYGAALEGNARIFALPYSGAGASAYYSWSKKTRDMDFLGVQLPGRENRFNEELITHLPTLLNNIITEIKPLINKPYVLFGLSRLVSGEQVGVGAASTVYGVTSQHGQQGE